MPGNSTPIFTKVGDISWVDLTAAVNDVTGVSANYGLAFTADATNGSYLRKIILQPKGTSTSPATFPAGVVRFFINNGSTPGTAANNSLYKELLLPALTSGLDADTTTLWCPSYEILCDKILPPSYRIYVGYTGALSASVILGVTAEGGDF